MTQLIYHNGVSIAILVLYVPALLIAIHLALRHGHGRSSCWIFLIVFTVVRLLSSAFQLASISRPTDTSLYIGYGILNSIGIFPLELSALGLLNRVLESIARKSNRPAWISPIYLQAAQIFVLVAMILDIMGGIKASEGDDVLEAHTFQKAAARMLLIMFGTIVTVTGQTGFSIASAEFGEERLLSAVAASLPFFTVRLMYAAIGTFGHDERFNSITGSVTICLWMALLMELAIVVIFEGVGLTLRKIPQEERPRMGSYIGMDVRNRRSGENGGVVRDDEGT